jgi:hypothetical protein
MITPDARLWHPWLRINRVLRVMLHERWSAQAWAQVRADRPRRSISEAEQQQFRALHRVWMTCTCGAAISRHVNG